MRSATLAAVVALTLPGCYPCDLTVGDTCIAYHGGPRTADEETWRLAIERSTALWGMTPHALDGWTIVIHEGHVRCYGIPGQGGCTHPELKQIHIHPFWTPAGPCDTFYFVHEVGHVRYPMPFHDEPGWDGWVAEAPHASACPWRWDP